MSAGNKLPYDTVLPIAQRLAAMLLPACDWLQIAGSLRRGVPLVSDVELVATPKTIQNENALWWLLDALIEEDTIQKAQGIDKNGKPFTRWGKKYRALTFCGVKFDVFLCDEDNRGYQYWLRTGPAKANEWLAKRAKSKKAPFRLDEGYCWYGEHKLKVPDEATLFRLFGIPLITPSRRSEETYRQQIDHRSHAWGDVKACLPPPPLPAPRQMQFAGNGFDRHEWISEKDAGGRATPAPAPLNFTYADYTGRQWVDAATGKVWVCNGWRDGKRHYILVGANSAIAIKQLEHIRDPRRYTEERDQLRRWLYPQQQWVFRHFVDASDLPFASLQPDTAQTLTVPIAQIIPTQKTVSRWRMHVYATTYTNNKDERGNRPFGVRFAGSERILLMDGHHRYAAALWRRKTVFELDVQDYACTFEQACGLIVDEDNGDDFLADVLEEVVAILKENAIACCACQQHTGQMWASQGCYYCSACWEKRNEVVCA